MQASGAKQYVARNRSTSAAVTDQAFRRRCAAKSPTAIHFLRTVSLSGRPGTSRRAKRLSGYPDWVSEVNRKEAIPKDVCTKTKQAPIADPQSSVAVLGGMGQRLAPKVPTTSAVNTRPRTKAATTHVDIVTTARLPPPAESRTIGIVRPTHARK